MNIYVSHLSWGTSSEGLGNLFMQFGEVASANVITDRETGRSRGFGFVEMPNEEEGQKAIDQLMENDWLGTDRLMVVRLDEERTVAQHIHEQVAGGIHDLSLIHI